jgi:hypothetical protein
MDQQLEFFDLQRQALWAQFKELVQAYGSDVASYHRLSSVAREMVRLDFDIAAQVTSQLSERSKYDTPAKRKRNRGGRAKPVETKPVEIQTENEPSGIVFVPHPIETE